MSQRADLMALLPAGLAEAVEAATGMTIAGVRPRGGGGASREGAELDLKDTEGVLHRTYMNYDVHKAGAGDDAAFLREAAVIRALSGPLADAGVRVAKFYAALPDQRALVGGYVAGEANYNKLQGDAARLQVAADFADQLARLHRIDVASRPVEGMGEVQPTRDLIARRIAWLREGNAGARWDPLIHIALDWIEANIPADLPPPVIVHGDAGPANFLYADGKVTALLDWELVHYGDPMADLAMIAIRNLFQPFAPLPQVFAAYEAAGGHKVDLARVRYWRLLFQTQFARRARLDDPDAPPPPNLGMNMVYSTIHRRVLSEALAEVAGVPITPPALPAVPTGPRERSFAIALDDLRDAIVPRLADQQSSVKAKGLARLVKWWRDIERYEPAMLAEEKTEIEATLGQKFESHPAAWAATCERIRAGTLPLGIAIRLVNARVTREAMLMADAMGGLAATGFKPLR